MFDYYFLLRRGRGPRTGPAGQSVPLRRGERDLQIHPVCVSPPVFFISLFRPRSLSVSPPVISLSPGGSVAPPMIANWGWTSTAGWGWGCRPPRWGRPSWRCGCPGTGCCPRDEAWSWTQFAPISNKATTKNVSGCTSHATREPCCAREVVAACQLTCLLSFSRQACSLMREPAVLSTTVRHKSMCLTDLSLVRAHSFARQDNQHVSNKFITNSSLFHIRNYKKCFRKSWLRAFAQ